MQGIHYGCLVFFNMGLKMMFKWILIEFFSFVVLIGSIFHFKTVYEIYTTDWTQIVFIRAADLPIITEKEWYCSIAFLAFGILQFILVQIFTIPKIIRHYKCVKL